MEFSGILPFFSKIGTKSPLNALEKALPACADDQFSAALVLRRSCLLWILRAPPANVHKSAIAAEN